MSIQLACSKCKRRVALVGSARGCPECQSPLEVLYDFEVVKEKLSFSALSSRRGGVWKYQELLPTIPQTDIVTLGEGRTFLSRAERLGGELGLKNLLLKDETTNPTGSFLDRGTTVSVSWLKHQRCGTIAIPTTGNLGASVAAYAARAALPSQVFIPPRVDLGKLYQMIAFGAEIEVARDFEKKAEEFSKRDKSSYLLSPQDPFFREGEKTTGFELYEDQEWKTSLTIVVPVGNGGHIAAIWKAYKELAELGLTRGDTPRLIGVQTSWVSPIVNALSSSLRGDSSSSTSGRMASEITIHKPALYSLAVDAIQSSQGQAVTVSSVEILQATKLLARMEGVFSEPAASSTVAALPHLIANGEIESSERVVCIITGGGLKDPLTVRRLAKSGRVMRSLREAERGRVAMRIGRTKLRILQLLARRQLHGYGVWKAIEREYGIRISIPAVYQHLSELEALGLVHVGDPQRGKLRRDVRPSMLTERGARLLRSM